MCLVSLLHWVHCTLYFPNAGLQGCCMAWGVHIVILLHSACGKNHVNKQIKRLRVDVIEGQIVRTRICTTKSSEATISHMRLSRSHFSVINSSWFYVSFMLHDSSLAHVCVSYYLHVCTGVCESPWTGRLPPQRLHPWSTGCALQAWPRGSHRSGCTEFRPSAGAPGIRPPLGPQGELEEKYTWMITLKHTHLYKCALIHRNKPISTYVQ